MRIRKPRPEDDAYAKTASPAALEREEERQRARHPCCWESVDGAHHPLCRNYVEPAVEQEGLL